MLIWDRGLAQGTLALLLFPEKHKRLDNLGLEILPFLL